MSRFDHYDGFSHPKSYVSQSLPRAPLDESEFSNSDSTHFTFDLDAHKDSPADPPAGKPRRKPPPMDPESSPTVRNIPSSPRQTNISDIINGLDTQIHQFQLRDDDDIGGDEDEEDEDFRTKESGKELGDEPRPFDDDYAIDDTYLDSYNTERFDGNNFDESSIKPLNTGRLSPPQLHQSHSSEYDTDYSNSSPSIDNQHIPYPIDSPLAQSASSLSYNGASGPDSPMVNPGYNVFEESPSPSYQTVPISPIRTGSQTTTSTKSVPLRPTISTPITNMQQFNTTNDSLRNPNINTNSTAFSNLPHNNGGGGTGINYGPAAARTHRKSSSLSSIWSSSSSKNINLAALKKTLNTRPGEGERSKYVYTLRKNLGTAYNESLPGKWKLPTGILPIDKRTTYTTSNNKYIRLGGGVTQTKVKRGTGVGLKHGHLAPRLLASEVDDNDDLSLKIKNSQDQKKAEESNSGSTTTLTDGSDTPKNRSSGSSLLASAGGGSTEKNSLSRTGTANSSLSAVTSSQSKSPSTGTSKRASISSGSSGSISDVGNGFYQHASYKYDRFNGEEEDYEEQDTLDVEEKEAPKLFLANPDASDSD